MSNEAVGMVGVAVIVGLICGVLTAGMAIGRDRSGLWFFAGFFFGPLGLLATALLLRQGLATPKGMLAVQCSRCGANQNIAKTDTVFECWQCKIVKPLPPIRG